MPKAPLGGVFARNGARKGSSEVSNTSYIGNLPPLNVAAADISQ